MNIRVSDGYRHASDDPGVRQTPGEREIQESGWLHETDDDYAEDGCWHPSIIDFTHWHVIAKYLPDFRMVDVCYFEGPLDKVSATRRSARFPMSWAYTMSRLPGNVGIAHAWPMPGRARRERDSRDQTRAVHYPGSLHSAPYPVGIMKTRHCTCGAVADVRRQTRTAAGHEEIVYRVICPVCGQLGPAIPAAEKDEALAIAEAIEAWNAMIARVRPLEA